MAEGTVLLEAKTSSILDFERFVDGVDFLEPGERDRLKVAGGEILDNIVKHASPLYLRRIRARAARRGSTLMLGFYFRAPSFASFACGEPLSGAAEPLFDPAFRRWRGIGLVMCRNLARKVVFRPGEMMDRIFLEF